MDGMTPMRQAEPAVARGGLIVNALTVDVEDYFQVEAMAHVVARADWDAMPRRVEANVDRLLELFARVGAKATFFTLGWIAERHPVMVRRIVGAGHELASHGMLHLRADRQTRADFAADVRASKRLLEDIGRVPVRGYRAATFSIGQGNLWAFAALAEAGYAYSSSIYPIAHDLYGMPDAPRVPFRPEGADIIEIPMTTLRAFGRNWPVSGGGYFRLLPYRASRAALRRVNAGEGRPAVFYMHPWEIDPAQPRLRGLPAKSRFRHYLNLARMEGRLVRLLGDFAWGRMDEIFLGRGR